MNNSLLGRLWLWQSRRSNRLNPHYMKKDLSRQLGAEKKVPQIIGQVLNEYFHSNQPLARGYRAYLAATENAAEKGGLR